MDHNVDNHDYKDPAMAGSQRKPDPGRPRILLVTPQPYYEERGTPIAVSLAARAMVESGFGVDLLSFPLGEAAAVPGIRIERCGNPFGVRHVRIGFSAGKLLLDASLLRSFEHLLARRRYVAVHAVEEAAWLASVLCPLHGVRFVYDMASAIPNQVRNHWLLGRQPIQFLLRAAERRVIKRAAHVVCSGGLADHVRELVPDAAVTEWRFPASDERVDPSTVAALCRRHQIAQDDHVLLYAGNFSSYQGIELLREAFIREAASDPDLLLVCIGAADQKDAHLFMSHVPEPLRGRVRVVRRQPRAMMPAWLALADCLVSLRTSGDNVPLKVFEYMAAGKPIIATAGPAHQPLLNDTRAFLCTTDITGVAGAIRRVFADPGHASVIGERAAEYASRHFSWTRFRELVAGVYMDVLRAPLPVPRPATGPAARPR